MSGFTCPLCKETIAQGAHNCPFLAKAQHDHSTSQRPAPPTAAADHRHTHPASTSIASSSLASSPSPASPPLLPHAAPGGPGGGAAQPPPPPPPPPPAPPADARGGDGEGRGPHSDHGVAVASSAASAASASPSAGGSLGAVHLPEGIGLGASVRVAGLTAQNKGLNGTAGRVVGVHGLGERVRVAVLLDSIEVLEPVRLRAANVELVSASPLPVIPYSIGGVVEAVGLQNDRTLNGRRGRVIGTQLSEGDAVLAQVAFPAPHGKIFMHPRNIVAVHPAPPLRLEGGTRPAGAAAAADSPSDEQLSGTGKASSDGWHHAQQPGGSANSPANPAIIVGGGDPDTPVDSLSRAGSWQLGASAGGGGAKQLLGNIGRGPLVVQILDPAAAAAAAAAAPPPDADGEGNGEGAGGEASPLESVHSASQFDDIPLDGHPAEAAHPASRDTGGGEGEDTEGGAEAPAAAASQQQRRRRPPSSAGGRRGGSGGGGAASATPVSNFSFISSASGGGAALPPSAAAGAEGEAEEGDESSSSTTTEEEEEDLPDPDPPADCSEELRAGFDALLEARRERVAAHVSQLCGLREALDAVAGALQQGQDNTPPAGPDPATPPPDGAPEGAEEDDHTPPADTTTTTATTTTTTSSSSSNAEATSSPPQGPTADPPCSEEGAAAACPPQRQPHTPYPLEAHFASVEGVDAGLEAYLCGPHLDGAAALLSSAGDNATALDSHFASFVAPRAALSDARASAEAERRDAVAERIAQAEAEAAAMEPLADSQAAQLEGDREGARAEGLRLSDECASLEARAEALREAISAKRGEISEVSSRIDGLTASRTTFDSESEPLLKGIAAAEAEGVRLGEELASTGSALKAGREEVASREAFLSEVSGVAEQCESEAQAARQRLLSRNRMKYATRKAVSRLGEDSASEARASVARLGGVQADIEKLKREASRMKGEVRALEMHPDMSLDVEKLTLRKSTAAKTRKFREAKEAQDVLIRISQSKESIADLQGKIAEVEGRGRALEAELPSLRAATVSARLEAGRQAPTVHLIQGHLERALLAETPDLQKARNALSEMQFRVMCADLPSETAFDIREEASRRWKELDPQNGGPVA